VVYSVKIDVHILIKRILTSSTKESETLVLTKMSFWTSWYISLPIVYFSGLFHIPYRERAIKLY